MTHSVIGSLQEIFPTEIGRVNGYAFSKGVAELRLILQLDTDEILDRHAVCLQPDQIEDWAISRFFAERERVQEIQDFSKVLVSSGILTEGATL